MFADHNGCEKTRIVWLPKRACEGRARVKKTKECYAGDCYMPHDNIIPLSSEDTTNEFLKFAHEKLMEIMPSFPQIPRTLIQKPFEDQADLSFKIGEIKTYFSSDENAGKIDDYIEQLGFSDLTRALKNTNKQSAASYQFIVDNFLSVNGLLRLYVQQLEW